MRGLLVLVLLAIGQVEVGLLILLSMIAIIHLNVKHRQLRFISLEVVLVA